MTLPQEVIRQKRDGGVISHEDLAAFCQDFLAGKVADYQMTALLMAIAIRGMDRRETASLTRIMRDSGAVLSWGAPRHLVVDKHSTGGVGDKTSLLLLPLLLGEGLTIPMMAGRGLGHTGGTLDKLEAVGWKVYMPLDQAQRQVTAMGGAIFGQTADLAPLDRRLYALRDVTATIESIPLIVGSILSKKLAEGLGGLVMDVKFGSGAFMPDQASARALALALKDVGAELGLAVRCVLTNMDSPLGAAAGNALEVFEAIEILHGRGPADVRMITLELAAEMVQLAYPERPAAPTMERLARRLADGSAWAAFLKLAHAQGGDLRLLEQPETLLRARIRQPVEAPATGVIQTIDVRALGIAVVELGGGRRTAEGAIDPWVGLTELKHVGDRVGRGAPLAIVHGQDEASVTAAAKRVAGAYAVQDADVLRHDLILERL